MKVRVPLYAQMLAWFFLNLMLLATVFWIFFTLQFSVGLDSLLLGHAGERIQGTSILIGNELRDKPATEWNSVLKRVGDAYGVDFHLFRPDGTQIAGSPIQLAPEVRARMLERARPPQRLRPPGRPAMDSMIPEPPDSPEAPSAAEAPLARSMPPGPGHMRPPAEFPKFMVRTSNPTRYWVGVFIRVPHRDVDLKPGDTPLRPEGPPRPVVLLASSDSISGSGLFVDTRPWMLVGIGAVVISILFWLPLARGFTRAISQMTHATEEIASGRFAVRVKSRRPDELGRLGEAINQMASRLSGFVTGQKRFLGDIAHELCSPIARIQLLLGIIEQRNAADSTKAESNQAPFDDLREEVQQMSALVNELLSFSKASIRPESIKLQLVLLNPLVDQAARREAGGADAIQNNVRPDICVLADPDLLLRSLANLLRNAIRYAGSDGPITVAAQETESAVIIRISDCGPGVSPESLPMLFDPFYRPELSRDRQTGGAGLGLAIVKTCIESCQGTVTCRNREPKGFEVELKLKVERASCPVEGRENEPESKNSESEI